MQPQKDKPQNPSKMFSLFFSGQVKLKKETPPDKVYGDSFVP